VRTVKYLKMLIVVALLIYVVRAPERAAGTLKEAGHTAYALAVVMFDGISAFIAGLSQ
jgi:hypothetical protein